MVAALTKHEREVVRRLVKHLRKEARRCLKIVERSHHSKADEKVLAWRIEEIGLLRRLMQSSARRVYRPA